MSIALTSLDDIRCNSDLGCRAFFQASPSGCCYSAETRKQARAEGWLVNIQQPYSTSGRHLPRLDFCPEHADRARRRYSLATTTRPGDVRGTDHTKETGDE